MSVHDFAIVFIALVGVMHGAADVLHAFDDKTGPSLRWLIRVDPVGLGQRERDELPAAVELDAASGGGELGAGIDVTTIRVVRVDADGKPIAMDRDERAANSEKSQEGSLPFRWYDASIPDDFPEFQDYVSRTGGKLLPHTRERGGHYLNAMGDCRKGRLVWLHTQASDKPSYYAISARPLAAGKLPPHLPPQGWIGDGQARCAEASTQAVHSDHLRIDLDDWNGDGLVDVVAGDDFGHVFLWPNLGTRSAPRYEYTRLILDADGRPLDVGTCAAPKVCDWDADGDLDLIVGTDRNRLVWFENVGSNRERKLAYRGLVEVDGQPLELPVAPLTRGEPEIFSLDYYPVPEFVDWDGDGDGDLLAGGYITGSIFLYENVGGMRGAAPKLVLRGPLEADGARLNVGHWCAAPCAVDLDADGDLDLLSGHTPFREPGMKAGIRRYENVASKNTPRLKTVELSTEKLWSITLGSPRAHDWDGDGDLDLVIGVRSQILLLENTGTRTAPTFNKPPLSVLPKWGPAPVMADQLLDWNGDGRIDLVSGMIVRMNAGGENPWSWPRYVSLLPRGKRIDHRSGTGDDEHSTHLDDFDRDGAIDILFGDWFGYVWLHRNRGTSQQPDFDLDGVKLTLADGAPIQVGPIGLDPTKDFNALQGARTVVAAADFDGDGHRDLIVGDTFGKVRYFRQCPQPAAKEGAPPDATVKSPKPPTFEPAVLIGDLGIRLNVCATDWNQDGRPDVIAGSANGKVQIYLNTWGRGKGDEPKPNDTSKASGTPTPFAAGITPKLPPIMQPRVLLGDLNGDGDDDLYFPSTQGTCFVERSFLQHGYARGVVTRSSVE